METQSQSPPFAPPHIDSSRPSLGFPLGSALLLLLIFTFSGVFSCFYHWDKLRSLRRSRQADLESFLSSSKPDLKTNRGQSLPVVMPGDRIPRFIALPCPCEPPRAESVVVQLPEPPKPPPFPVPLY